MTAKTLRDLMTENPMTLQSTQTALEAARVMRDNNIGDVIVLDDGEMCGIVTDRDLVVRAMADGQDPKSVPLSAIASMEMTTLQPDSNVGDALALMREKALRRIPVVEHGKPVGIVSLGDLAQERDTKSTLADISAAPPNK